MQRTSGPKRSMANLYGAPWEVANKLQRGLWPIFGHDQFMQRYSEFRLRWNVSTNNNHVRSARKGNVSFNNAECLYHSPHTTLEPRRPACASPTHTCTGSRLSSCPTAQTVPVVTESHRVPTRFARRWNTHPLTRPTMFSPQQSFG